MPPIEVQNDILRETFDNIAYGKESREAVGGRSDGKASPCAAATSAPCPSDRRTTGSSTTRSSGPATRLPPSSAMFTGWRGTLR